VRSVEAEFGPSQCEFTFAPAAGITHADNMILFRAIGGIGDPGSRVENRVGEPAANPYLYLASQMLAGLDGITRGLTPPAPSNSPYDGDAPRLPQTLLEAVDSLERSDFWRAEMGSAFIDYLVRIKKFEINRYLSEISEWEQQEYFQLF
jgi:glutamine synthetase